METQIVAAICKCWLRGLSLLDLETCTVCPILTSLSLHRCRSFFCDYCTRSEGSSNGRCQGSTAGCLDLGDRPFCYIQLPPQCLQNQERWLSVLLAPVLNTIESIVL
jgi:hypothetical protein